MLFFCLFWYWNIWDLHWQKLHVKKLECLGSYLKHKPMLYEWASPSVVACFKIEVQKNCSRYTFRFFKVRVTLQRAIFVMWHVNIIQHGTCNLGLVALVLALQWGNPKLKLGRWWVLTIIVHPTTMEAQMTSMSYGDPKIS